MQKELQMDFSQNISSTEEIIECARNGQMYILIDHEDRENEGDLIIPAQMCKAADINFMATYGRGLICLALSAERVDTLGLSLMSTQNASRHQTAFTLSIEAREGISTGISAADRAHTIATAINPHKGRQDIVSPGHIFPLRANDGGVLVRAGHTEASVDISRLAGLIPAGVICEVMNDDGTMARLPELVVFARKHGLKIGTISDLIAYRRRHDNLVSVTSEKIIMSEFGGEWLMRTYSDTSEGSEHIALIKGDITTPQPVLTRMHRHDPISDIIGAGEKHKAHDFANSMKMISQEGRGVAVLLRDFRAKLTSESDTSPLVLRQYGLGAQILVSLGLSDIILVTNSPKPKIIGLDAYGLSIVDTIKIKE